MHSIFKQFIHAVFAMQLVTELYTESLFIQKTEYFSQTNERNRFALKCNFRKTKIHLWS